MAARQPSGRRYFGLARNPRLCSLLRDDPDQFAAFVEEHVRLGQTPTQPGDTRRTDTREHPARTPPQPPPDGARVQQSLSLQQTPLPSRLTSINASQSLTANTTHTVEQHMRWSDAMGVGKIATATPNGHLAPALISRYSKTVVAPAKLGVARVQ